MRSNIQIAIMIIAFILWLISVFTFIPVEVGLVVFASLMLIPGLFGDLAERMNKKYQIIYIGFVLYILGKNLFLLIF